MPYKYKNGWMGRVRIKGTCKTKLFQKKQEALTWESIMHTDPAKLKMSMGYSLLEWCNEYLSYAEKYVPKTFNEKKSVFKNLFKMFDHTQQVTTFTPEQALKYLTKQFRTRSGYASNKDKKNLASAWEWGKKYKGLAQINPFKIVDKFPEKRTPRYIPSENHFWLIYDFASEDDKTMLVTYFFTGARRNEVFRLRWMDDIDFENRSVRLYTRKRKDGSEEFEWLPMADELFESLVELRERYPDNEYVFTNPVTGTRYKERRDYMTWLCRQAGIKPFGFHAIRHVFARKLQKGRVDSYIAQRFLRHKKLSTTERYFDRLGSELSPALKVLSGGKGRKKTKSLIKSG